MRLWNAGIPTICPHLNTAMFDGDYQVFAEGYLEIMKLCNIVFLLEGWQDSSGTMKEVEVALSHGIFVIPPEMFDVWLHHNRMTPPTNKGEILLKS